MIYSQVNIAYRAGLQEKRRASAGILAKVEAYRATFSGFGSAVGCVQADSQLAPGQWVDEWHAE
jgi:hypothetical protein